MVAQKENLLSLGHQVNMERHTFKTQRAETPKQKTLHLLQHCQEMQEGVRRAQQHNRQLLQQFKEAQGTLREMMEYEKHLVGIPQWRQQLQENTWEMRNLNNTTDRTSCSPGPPLPAQLSYDGSFHSAHIRSSWMVPPRNPHHPQDSTGAPLQLPSNPPQLYHQATGLSLHRSLPWQNVPDQPWFWTAAAARSPSGPEARLWVTEPPAESGQHSQRSSAPSSDEKRADSRNSPSGRELDTQPDGSDSTTESSQVSRKKRGKAKHTFSEGERHSSPDLQAVSVVMTGEGAAQSSGSVASSESRSTMRSAGADGGPQKLENRVKERNKKNESECGQRGREESGSQGQSSGRGDRRMNNERSSSRSEGKNEQGKDDEQLQEEDPEKSDEKVDDEEKQERKEDISKRKNTIDEEENAEAEEEMEEEEESDGVKDEDNRKLDSTRRTRSSEEDVDAESEDLSEEDEESDENNKPRDSSYDEEEDEMEEVAKKKGDEAAQGEDESDSDDCIISLQISKRLHVIPEAARGDEDVEAQPGNSEEDSDEFSANVKDPKTQDKEMKHEQKATGFCKRMEIFQVETEEGSSRGDQPSDSDEFDHFFD